MTVIRVWLKQKDAVAKIKLGAAVDLESGGRESQSAREKSARGVFFAKSGSTEVEKHYLEFSDHR